MSLWRREAVERFPELHREIADLEGKFFLWSLLRHSLLLPAYEKEPPDLVTAARVFDYAAWSWAHRNPLVRRVVADDFYDFLGDYPKTRTDMPRWLTVEQLDALKSVWIRTSMTEESFAAFRREFLQNKNKIKSKLE